MMATTMPATIYRDLARGFDGPPSLLAIQARDWVTRSRLRWTPDIYDPADTLAAYGAIALTSAVQRPAGWSGLALHGPDDLVALISRCDLADRGTRVMLGDTTVLAITHDASKLWGGRVTIGKIWTTCKRALAGFDAEGRPNRIKRSQIDSRAMTERVSATGYDRLAVTVPIEDGFSVAAHHSGIALAGARPAIELYSLIGASVIEECGRWPRPSEPNIPALSEEYPLRDHFDLRAYTLAAPRMRVEWRLAGRRGYLVAA